MTSVVPYGAWPSPITAARVVAGVAAVGEIRPDGDHVWWSESRPEEGGRIQLVRRDGDGDFHDLFPAAGPVSWNARTRVHEYGGGAWAVRGGVVVFANWDDQRLYRVDAGDEPRPLTPVPEVPGGLRFAEVSWLDDRWLLAVAEDHEPATVAGHGEAENTVVAVPLDGSAGADRRRLVTLAGGADFFAFPVAAGDRLAWVQWDHPNMPWDGTTIIAATIERNGEGDPTGVTTTRQVGGGPAISAIQPVFTRSGDLLFSDDRSGWWAPHRAGPEGSTPVLARPVEAEIGGPAWVHGMRWLAPLGDGRIACSVTSDGLDRLGLIGVDGTLSVLDTPFNDIRQVVAGTGDGEILVVAGSPTWAPAPHRVDADSGTIERLSEAAGAWLAEGYVSTAEPVSFPTSGGRTAHALYYPPTNGEVSAPDGELPPLLVFIHGGPTSSAAASLSLGRQYWTSRGFAVVDVNHGGSTGFGSAYRRQLDGRWGMVDVDDCIAAARHLAAQGKVDPSRLAIRGGSAGGFTTLAALTFHDVFAAGASHYGVVDLEALAVETHKFESRYLDRLIGPYPEDAAVYRDRSPIHHIEHCHAPLIVFQGLEDEVVPPAQAEMIVAALAANGIPHAYVPFAGEQHGFRRAATIVRALEAELWFYGRVFGFTPADDIEPVPGAVGL